MRLGTRRRSAEENPRERGQRESEREARGKGVERAWNEAAEIEAGRQGQSLQSESISDYGSHKRTENDFHLGFLHG